jgi:phytoene desaturase
MNMPARFPAAPTDAGRRVIVAGAGPGGLAAAMLLARAGAEVTVVERKERVGGRTATLERDGFRFDLGPTFFLYPAILAEIFRDCGFDFDREVALTRLDPMYHLIFEQGGEIRATADPERLKAEIARLDPQDAEKAQMFAADNRAKFKAFRPILQRPFTSYLDWVKPDMLRALPLMRPHRTVDTDLARHFRDPRVRLAFSFQSKYLGMSPFKCPSLFTILSSIEYEHGVFHPKGGCGAVMAAMARCAERMGVAFRLGEPIRRILFEGRRAVGVETERGELRAEALMLNADFANSMASLVPDRMRRRWSDARLAKKRYSCSTFMLYLGVEGLERDLAHHTVLLSRDYRAALDAIDRGLPPEDPSLYVQNAGITDDTLAPEGMSTLYVLAPVGNTAGGYDWTANAPAFRAKVMEKLRALGIRDLERRIRSETMVTPADWAQDMAIHRGATFNLAHNLGQMLHHRPRNRFEEFDRMYLVGGGTHPGSGLPTIFESARISTRLLAEDLGLDAEAIPTELPLPAEAR